ncbi:MAG: tetratricopeptide repeat protein [Myxococcaceae bacterium]|nr:tetratricopeptide repeat protein [Myxococcaceae bacterium]
MKPSSSPALRPATRQLSRSESAGRVLVVNASSGERGIIEVALRRLGFEVFGAESARDAERLLSFGSVNPELVICATALNGDDGFSFVAQLRGNGATAKIPVLLLAAPKEAQSEELAAVVGADLVLPTPIHVRDVVSLGQLLLAPSKDAVRTLDTARLPVAYALRALLSADRVGTLELEGGRAHVAFRKGEVVDAHLDGWHGEGALLKALALSQGSYRLVERPFSFDPTFRLSVRELVNRVMPQLARWDELLVRSVPLAARLSVDFPALARALPSLPDEVNGVVRLFDGQRDVRRVLLDSPLDQAMTLEVATRLYTLGVVLPDPTADETIEVLRPAPRLFEPVPREAEEQMRVLFDSEVPSVASDALDRDAFDWSDRALTEPVEDPSAGWQASPLESLNPELRRAFDAFQQKPVIEERGGGELRAFTQGRLEQAPQAPLEAALLKPLPLTSLMEVTPASTPIALPDAFLEQQFFGLPKVEARAEVPEVQPADWDDEVTQPSIPAATVAEAVLGRPEEVPGPDDGRTIAVAGIIGLALVATGITVWKLADQSFGDELPPLSAASTMVAPALPALAPAPVMEPVPEAVAAPPSQALLDATALYEKGKLPEARAALEALVAADPTQAQAWLMLGLVRFDSRDVQGAQEAATTALAMDSKLARVHLLQASIDLETNRKDAAQASLQKYLELDPNGPFVDEAKALLRR